MPTREDLAWAAGFIDGEGSFNWNVTDRSRDYGLPRFSVNQVDEEPIQRLHSLMPFLKRAHVRARPHSPKPQHMLYCNNFETVQQVLVMLWPWLSAFKRDDAVRVLNNFRDQRTALDAAGRKQRRSRGGVSLRP